MTCETVATKLEPVKKGIPLTQERLRYLLHYDMASGIFTWKKRTSWRVKIGSVAGHRNKSLGYILIKIDGTLYLAHRLAWLYMYGPFDGEIDHRKNKDGFNNRISNLRLCTSSQNKMNRSAQ